MGRFTDVQPGKVIFEIRLIKFSDVPRRLSLCGGSLFHLVVAGIGIAGQVADIGNVDDMLQVIALKRQRATECVGKNIGAHITDMLVIIDRRAAGVDLCRFPIERFEILELARQAVEQFKWRWVGHAVPLTPRFKKGRGRASDPCRKIFVPLLFFWNKADTSSNIALTQARERLRGSITWQRN